MHLRSCGWIAGLVGPLTAGCVPSGNAGSPDAGASLPQAAARPAIPPTAAITAVPAPPSDVMRAPFEDDFEHSGSTPTAGSTDGAVDGARTSPATAAMLEPGADWTPTQAGIWHVEGGKLCGEHARNHGIWLKRVLPFNARIEFDAVGQSTDGDLKAEYWGDGRSSATAISYTDATSYLTIFGGWHNKFHVLARINEHGNDRKEITIDPNSDDPREKPVVAGQSYHFKVERLDGKTVKWWVNGIEMLTFQDAAPLVGVGHDHFGFNDWDVKVCFDNVRVVPLP